MIKDDGFFADGARRPPSTPLTKAVRQCESGPTDIDVMPAARHNVSFDDSALWRLGAKTPTVYDATGRDGWGVEFRRMGAAGFVFKQHSPPHQSYNRDRLIETVEKVRGCNGSGRLRGASTTSDSSGVSAGRWSGRPLATVLETTAPLSSSSSSGFSSQEEQRLSDVLPSAVTEMLQQKYIYAPSYNRISPVPFTDITTARPHMNMSADDESRFERLRQEFRQSRPCLHQMPTMSNKSVFESDVL
uniref:Uncharacterized protein n=1 Tax=Plectus sambesii TaxID=2011161 RepID=A0A914V5Y5_9BILA